MTIHWKNKKIFSIKLRNGKFCLLQMLKINGQVAVFNEFHSIDEWDDDVLNKSKILFFTFLLDSVLSRSIVKVHKNVKPVQNLYYYDEKEIATGSEFSEITIWTGTKDEKSFISTVAGDSELSIKTMNASKTEEIYTPISNKDYELYKDLELTHLSEYPSFNERLNLCSIFNKNIDPLKELAFNRELDRECIVYVDIISGKVKLSELGY